MAPWPVRKFSPLRGPVFAHAMRVGLAGLPAALIGLIVAAGPLHAKPESRDDGRIAFTFGESGDLHPSQLAVMDADGKNRHVLPPWPAIGVSWSSDGRFIAYGSLGHYGISTISVDGRPRGQRVVRNGDRPDWSPDGSSIAFDRSHDIWGVNLNSHRQRRLVRHASSARWSPDGRKLAFERGNDVWVFDLARKKEHLLVRNGSDADWSPDGRQIAFDRCGTQNLESTCFIYLAQSDWTGQRRLFKGEEPVWSPSGQELAFIGEAGGRSDAIIRARLDGSGRRVLFGRRPYCGCGSLDWTRGRR
jgi:Tol biopolymer transport system component